MSASETERLIEMVQHAEHSGSFNMTADVSHLVWTALVRLREERSSLIAELADANLQGHGEWLEAEARTLRAEIALDGLRTRLAKLLEQWRVGAVKLQQTNPRDSAETQADERGHGDGLNEAADEVAALLAPATPDGLNYERLYFDLLMSVGQKHQGETRHETAKRYILQAERGSDDARRATPVTAATPDGASHR